MTGWPKLEAELDAWATAGRRAPLWWRDDDAVEPSAALDRLLALTAGAGLPLTLAVIPARCSLALPACLAGQPETLVVVQHGFAHRNHGGETAKKIELGPERPPESVLEELARGHVFMLSAFGARFRPLLVPPWNRIEDLLLPRLPELGLSALSTFGDAHLPARVPGLRIANCHVDIMCWAQPRGFLGEAETLGPLVERLRETRANGGPPIGLLTHHLAHDAPAWAFLTRLSACLAAHPGAAVLALEAVLAEARSGAEVAA